MVTVSSTAGFRTLISRLSAFISIPLHKEVDLGSGPVPVLGVVLGKSLSLLVSFMIPKMEMPRFPSDSHCSLVLVFLCSRRTATLT